MSFIFSCLTLFLTLDFCQKMVYFDKKRTETSSERNYKEQLQIENGRSILIRKGPKLPQKEIRKNNYK